MRWKKWTTRLARISLQTDQSRITDAGIMSEGRIVKESRRSVDMEAMEELISMLILKLEDAHYIKTPKKKGQLRAPKSGFTLQEALEEIEREKIKIVRFEFSDYHSISRSKTIPARHFREKVENAIPMLIGHLGCDPVGNLVEGTGYLEERNYGDAEFYSDLSTFQRVPWAEDTGRILVYPKFKDEIVHGYPRTIAQRLLGELRDLGFSLYTAHEYEFFVFDENTKKPAIGGIQAGATLRLAKNTEFVRSILDKLPEIGVDIECIETEISPGQYEVAYKPAFGIQAADNAFTFKNGIKEMAGKQGFLATFMTMPHCGHAGAGGHLNHSLWDTDRENNLMRDDNAPYGLSKIARNWMAGVLYHAPAITVLMSPTVNCLTYIRDDIFAPTNATWGIDNRSAAIRVKEGGVSGTYLENRIGSSAGCPYITLAATLAAGMDGIRKGYKLPPPIQGVAYNEKILPPDTVKLPTEMASALKRLLEDEVICKAFGEDFIKCFSALKRHELKLEREAAAKGIHHNKWAFDYYSEYI